VALGATVIRLAIPDFPSLALAGLALSGLGAHWIRESIVRAHGQAVERKAIATLKVPPGWVATSNVMLNGGGDLDVLIVGTDDSGTPWRYAVEIKSFESAMLRRNLLTGSEAIVKIDGRALPPGVIRQTLAAAVEVQGTPVLWLPRASGQSFAMKCGVVVVPGNARALKKALRIPTSGLFG